MSLRKQKNAFMRERYYAVSKIDTYDPRFSALKKTKKNGKNASVILQDNRNFLLQLIREYKVISRKQLAELSGLQQATVTIIIKEFLKQGWVCENGRLDGGNGRSVKGFSFAKDFYVVSMRLTAVYIKLALYDVHINSTHVTKIFFKTDDSVKEALELMEDYLKNVVEKHVAKEKVLCVILGVEHIYRLIENDYAVWDEKRQEYCEIGKKLHDLTKYRVFTNRAINLSSYDIWDTYKTSNNIGDKYTTVVNIAISYDLESAVMVNGEPLYGKSGRCGQFGNLWIERDIKKKYNDVLTVSALLARAKELLTEYPESVIADIMDLNIRDVIAGYGKGDPLCRKVYDEVTVYLGYLSGAFIECLDPDILFVWDEIPNTDDFVISLREEASKYCGKAKAERISYFKRKRETKNDPVLIGGAKYAFDLVIRDIGIYN